MNEMLIVGRCINSAWSHDLDVGEVYGLQLAGTYAHALYAKVYQIPPEYFETEFFTQGEDRVWRIRDIDFPLIGEFALSRFDVLHAKPDIAAAIFRIKDREKFLKGTYREGAPADDNTPKS